MIRHVKEKKALFKAFRWHEILRSVSFAFLIACVIALPVALVIANAVVVWFWMWTPWALVISLAALGFGALWVIMIYALLNAYRPDHGLDLTRRRTIDMLVLGVIFFVTALIITLVIVPTYM